MKKILITLTGAMMIAGLTNCQSVDRTKAGGKEVIVASKYGPVFFNGEGYNVATCVDTLKKEGVTEITNVSGAPTGGLFSSYRSLTGSDACQAAGTKSGAAPPAADGK